MRRLGLGVQLALILALAMTTSLLAVVVVDRVNEVYRHKNDSYGRADNLALTLLELHARLSRNDFESAVTLAQRPSNWIYFGAWDGLHPVDIRDEDWERRLLALEPLESTAVDAIRVASRSYDFIPKVRRPPPIRAAPRAMSLGDAPRRMAHPPPADGSPRPWVIEPIKAENGDFISPAPDASPSNVEAMPITVYTVAVQPAGSEDWIVVHRLLRPPPLGGTLSIAFYALIAGAVVAGLALLVGRRVMAPFRQVAKNAELLGRGQQAPEVPVKGPKDVREIVAAFNSMNARVGQATDYQIGLLRSLGHDLKGPLAAVERLARDVQPEAIRAQFEERLFRVQSIVESIVSFSRAVMRDGELEQSDLAAMLETVVNEQADLGADAVANTPGRLLLTCRANAMERCLRNLVENAVTHGGSVRARLMQIGHEAVIQIDDQGPGLPEDMIERVFHPFHRFSDKPGGSGLGLAIARTIIVDQGGSLSLTNRTEGGLRAEVRIALLHQDA